MKKLILTIALALSLSNVYASKKNSCRDLPATTNCDSWVYTGETSEPYGDGNTAYYKNYSRTCKNFDGCGSYNGSWTETRKELDYVDLGSFPAPDDRASDACRTHFGVSQTYPITCANSFHGYEVVCGDGSRFDACD